MNIVYLEWEDAFTRSGWTDSTEVEAEINGRCMIQQCGFVLAENKDHIVFAGSYMPGDGVCFRRKFNGIHKIPKAWIRNRVNIATVEDKIGGKLKRTK